MASVGLPPPPINDSPGSFTWLEWYRQLRSYISTSGSVPWYVVDFAGSNITDIAIREHNTLQSLQGGTSGEMYHLTAAQYAALGTGGPGTVTSVGMSVPTGLSVAGSPITGAGTLAVSYTAGYSIPTTSSQTNWDTAYTDRNKWDGGSSGLTPATGIASLGGTTVGSNFFTLANPTAITFPRINADNTVSALDASTFRTAIGAGTSSTTGTVTSIATSGVITGGTITNTGTIGHSSADGDLHVPATSTTNNGKVLTAGATAGSLSWQTPAATGTNLGYTDATRVLTSDTGTDVTLPLVTTANAGLAPATGGGTTNFLRADASWAALPTQTGTTNLGYTASTRVLTSDTGTDVTLPLFTSTEAGLAPLSGGGTANFLRADGTWSAPSGGSGLAQYQVRRLLRR